MGKRIRRSRKREREGETWGGMVGEEGEGSEGREVPLDGGRGEDDNGEFVDERVTR